MSAERHGFIVYNREKTKEAEEIFARISAEMERKGFKQAELISYLNLPRGTYSSWKAGRTRTFCEHLGEISQFLEINVEYLVTGQLTTDGVVNTAEQELLQSFRKLNPVKQQAILQMAELLVE